MKNKREKSSADCLVSLTKELKHKHPILSLLLVDRILESVRQAEEYAKKDNSPLVVPHIWEELNEIVQKHLNN